MRFLATGSAAHRVVKRDVGVGEHVSSTAAPHFSLPNIRHDQGVAGGGRSTTISFVTYILLLDLTGSIDGGIVFMTDIIVGTTTFLSPIVSDERVGIPSLSYVAHIVIDHEQERRGDEQPSP
ncbi:hypothetical protein GW17_00015784 [Ensete ventricosum]|uniref:Uncharacterized protein n=1 Tax=Ensete ventricosum TaxID=4639 RepID=A0A444FBU5_ENSVE|nr:hypothetical protein GW17_00015784 [Ensete ventricosum]RZR72035.1 hypothetical protein BHM03_00009789 [Ensete ventricosum]